MSIRFYAFFLSVVLFGFGLYLLQNIIMPFVIAALLAYLCDPLADKLEVKIGRTFSTVLVMALMLIIVLSVIGVLLPMLIEQLINFMRQIPDYVQWLQVTLLPYLEQKFGLQVKGVEINALRELLKENWHEAGGFAQTVLAQASNSAFTFFVWLGNVVLIPVVFFYLLRDWDPMLERMVHMIPRAWLTTVMKLAAECNEMLSAFIRGQLIVMFALGGIYSAGLMIVGLDLALFIGSLAGLASIVPYLGAFVGIAAASLAAYMQFQELLPLVYVLMVFGIGQTLEGMLLTPILVGDKIGLHPVAVIFSIMAGGQLAGFTGVLLALPIAAVLMVFVRFMHEEYKMSDLYKSVDHG